MTEKEKERFFSKIAATADPERCWMWMAGKYTQGYGSFGLNHPRRRYSAHRLSWEIFKGPIPEGMCVLHRCDVRACVNPDHLFLGTRADNMADMYAKGRGTRHGSENPMALLTEPAVLQIRAACAAGRRGTQKEQAGIHGVSPVTISGIVNRSRWTHI